jgi:tetratricopeptide (TPR) repeat protein
MPDDKKAAGFFGGALKPEDIEKKTPEPKPAPAAPEKKSGGVGFLGAAAQSVPPQEKPKPAAAPQPKSPQLAAAQAKTQPAAQPAPKPAPKPAPVAPPAQAEVEKPPRPIPELSASALEFFRYAEEMYDQGFLDTAITAFRRGLEKDPGNTVASNNLAMAYMDKGRFDDAGDELERVLSRGVEDSEVLANLGYVLRKQGKDAQASEIYERYLKANPNAEDAGPIRGWIDKVKANVPVAAPAAASTPAAAAGGGGELEKLLKKAEGAYDAEDYENALSLFDQASVQDLNSAAALAGRGRAQAKLGLHEEGLASLREAAAMAPEDAEIHFVIGCILRGMQRDSEAAAALRKFLELKPQAENAAKILEYVEKHPAIDEEKAKIQKQPAWAQALDEPPPEIANAGLPETEATLAQQEGGVFGASAPQLEPVTPSEPAPPPVPAVGLKVPAAEPKRPADSDSQLNEIRELLSSGDANTALNKAQDLVAANPDLAAGKILIARAFGQQGDFAKALPILESVNQTEPNGDALFFMGRCLQELGRGREAVKAFEQCISTSDNDDLKSRAREIMSGMSENKKSVCAQCMQTVTVAQLEEVNGQLICPECREKMEQSMGGQAAVAQAQVEQAKASKPAPRKAAKKGGAAPVIVALIVLLLILPVGGMAGLYFAKPELYESVRQKLPAALPLPKIATAAPDPDMIPPDATPVEPAPVENPVQQSEEEKVEIPEGQDFVIASPPLTEVVAGVEYRHVIKVAGASPGEMEFGASFSRATSNAPKVDAKSGEMIWTPSAGDAREGEMILTLSAAFGDKKALPQPCSLKIRQPVEARKLPLQVSLLPGEAVCLASGDLDGDKLDDLLLCHGRYWQAEIVLYSGTGSGFERKSSLSFSGRPVAVGIGNFGDGSNKALIVDYWNRSLFFVGYDGGKLVALPGAIDLPARPVAAAFGNPDGDGPVGVAVVCPEAKAVLTYDAVAGAPLALFGQYPLPGEYLWKQLCLADFRAEAKEPGAQLALVRLGQERPNLFLLDFSAEKKWMKCSVGSGAALSVAVGDVAGGIRPPRPDLVIAAGAERPTIYTYLGQPAGEALQDKALPLPGGGALFGTLAADLDGNGTDDLVFLLEKKISFRLRSLQGEGLGVTDAVLPAGLAAPLGVATAGEFTGDKAEDVVYLDRAGNFVLVTSPGE